MSDTIGNISAGQPASAPTLAATLLIVDVFTVLRRRQPFVENRRGRYPRESFGCFLLFSLIEDGRLLFS